MDSVVKSWSINVGHDLAVPRLRLQTKRGGRSASGNQSLSMTVRGCLFILFKSQLGIDQLIAGQEWAGASECFLFADDCICLFTTSTGHSTPEDCVLNSVPHAHAC